MNPTWLLVLLAAGGVLVAVTRWTAGVDEDRKNFKTFMREIGEKVTQLGEKVDKILSRLPSRLAISGSPITLTDLGKQVAREIDADQWAEKLLPELRDRAKGKEPFEVHELCSGFVGKLEYTSEQKRLLRRVAFGHGLQASELPEVLVIVLRDKLLEATD